MGSLDGDLKKIAFDVKDVRRIVTRSGANIVHSDNGTIYVELEGGVYRVACGPDQEVKPYFIILHSSEAFNVSEHRMLFEVRVLPNDLVMGKDMGGQEHLCRWHGTSLESSAESEDDTDLCLETIERKLDSADVSSSGDLEDIKNMIKNLRNGHFFEELTSEFGSKIKEIAVELIDFRKDIKKRIEPGILEIASKDIPEASNQLEGINQTLENSTMKIMDINDEQMDLANTCVARLQSILSGNGGGSAPPDWGRAVAIIQEVKQTFSMLPEEARQIMDFIMPGLDAGEALMAQEGDVAAVQEALAESLATIEELSSDIGPENDAAQGLGDLCGELKGLFDELSEGGSQEDDGGESAPDAEALQRILEEEVETLRTIGGLSLKMMEPLSFQDLVGQRIQRIIRLVKTMEMRIEDLIISFGIKMQRHRENPAMTFEELDKEVEQYKSDLKGPQSEGEGLDQGEVDALLASL
jgi:chemotaxis regulatin CheY-phosphate phosphatase CheZ